MCMCLPYEILSFFENAGLSVDSIRWVYKFSHVYKKHVKSVTQKLCVWIDSI